MSSAYFDTSGVIACLLEARAALAAQRRARTLRSRAYAQAKEGWRELWEELVVIEADEEIVDRAADLAETHRLRGYDAVHLAAAEASGCGLLVSADRELCRASVERGIAVLDLNLS